jgi:hypothetical protein
MQGLGGVSSANDSSIADVSIWTFALTSSAVSSGVVRQEVTETGVSADEAGVEAKVLPDPTVDTVDDRCWAEAAEDRDVADGGPGITAGKPAPSHDDWADTDGRGIVLTPSEVMVVT